MRISDYQDFEITVFTGYWSDSGGGGGSTGGSGDSGTGGGSGGGGTGGNWYDDPCNYVTNPAQRTSVLTDPCATGSGWEPVNEVIVSVDIITNNITDQCLNEVYNKITEQIYKNKLSTLLRNFQVSDQITISLNTDNTLADNVYGRAYQQLNSEIYNIDLHTDVLKKCSQEFIASVYFHEAIHVFLKEHQDSWVSKTSSEHLEMLENYCDQLVESVQEIFPSLRRCRCSKKSNFHS
jgi:hypothetical protein